MWSYWAPGHSATLSTLAPESVPCQCPPASPQALQRWRISSRDRANPGTGVGRHPTSEEHLDSPSRARTRSPARRLDKPLAARPSCGKLLSALRPPWRGRPDATSTQQVGRAYPSHPTLLSVGGCKRGSTPRSSYTTPSTLPREEGASSKQPSSIWVARLKTVRSPVHSNSLSISPPTRTGRAVGWPCQCHNLNCNTTPT